MRPYSISAILETVADYIDVIDATITGAAPDNGSNLVQRDLRTIALWFRANPEVSEEIYKILS